MSEKIKKEILDKKNYSTINEDKRVFKFSYEQKDVFVIHSEKRSAHDRKKREKILEMITKAQNSKGDIQTEKLIKNRGMSKYLEKVKSSTRLNKDKVLEDCQWYGIVGICTNIKNLPPQKNLWVPGGSGSFPRL